MGKKRILCCALAALLFCCLAAFMCFGAQAVPVTELEGGMTLAPGSEVTVPQGGASYTYVYDAGGYGQLSEPVSGELEPGDTLTLLSAKKAGLTVHDGWQFSGWYCVLSGTQLTIFAQYSTQPTVSLSDKALKYGLQASAERMNTGGEVSVTVPDKYAGYVIEVTANGEPAKLKDGAYVFTMPEGNVTVDLSIRENSCFIQYDANGGSFSDGSAVYGEYADIASGSVSLTVYASPERDNYIFLGWESKTLSCQAGQRISVNVQPFYTVIFRAVWTPDPDTAVTLTLDAQGGNVEEGSVLIAPGDSTVLPSAWRDGYSFTGWNTVRDGSGDSYNAGDSIQYDRDLTLYAQWQAASCNVTVSIKHLGRSVTDVAYASITDSYGRIIVGENSGTGVFVFRNVPDGEYILTINSRTSAGVCSGIIVQQGKVISATLEAEMWR